MLTTTACQGDNQPEPSPSPPVTQEVFPTQGFIEGITDDTIQCTEDYVSVELILAGTTKYGGLKLSAEYLSDTIKVHSDNGFEVFVAGIAVGENDARVPFSMRDDDFDPKASTFIIDAEQNFAKVADSRIVAVTLCAGGM